LPDGDQQKYKEDVTLTYNLQGVFFFQLCDVKHLANFLTKGETLFTINWQ
jgi:hypothetical protein